MSEPAVATTKRSEAEASAKPQLPSQSAQSRFAELKVSGHLMTLDTGLFCVFEAPGGTGPDKGTGLPGVRISLPPEPGGRSDVVNIATFRDDGWLDGTGALVRITDGPAQVLVTIYQLPSHGAERAPQLQVLMLSGQAKTTATAAVGPAAGPALPAAPNPEALVHVQRTGDIGGHLGDWIGTRGSKLWVEGFSLTPQGHIAPDEIEYQAVLGRGWLSPWIEGGKFCGSRGMALPLLGLRVRLKGDAAQKWDCRCSATFVDGTTFGPAISEETCASEALSPLEAFRVELVRRGAQADRTRAAEQTPSARPIRRAGASSRPAKTASKA